MVKKNKATESDYNYHIPYVFTGHLSVSSKHKTALELSKSRRSTFFIQNANALDGERVIIEPVSGNQLAGKVDLTTFISALQRIENGKPSITKKFVSVPEDIELTGTNLKDNLVYGDHFNLIPNASRDTATEDIPSKSDSNINYPTPPDGGEGISNTVLSTIFDRADEIAAKTLKGRPATGEKHSARTGVRVRIDDDVIEWLKTKNPQYTTQINALLVALKEAEDDKNLLSPN